MSRRIPRTLSKSNLFLLFIIMAASVGCQTLGPHATTGGILGATSGSLVGAAIGSSEGKSGQGALAGALAGGMAGTALGDQMDEAQRKQLRLASAHQDSIQQSAVSIDDVVQMSQSGLGETLIVNQINANGIAFRPTTEHLIQMKSNGVSDSIISAYQNGPLAQSRSFRRQRMEEPPAIVPQPVLIEPQFVPACPPPVLHYARPRHFRGAFRY